MTVRLLWDTRGVAGRVTVSYAGCLAGDAQPDIETIDISQDAAGAMLVAANASESRFGACMSRMSVDCSAGSFTVRTADIDMQYPVYIPSYHVIVTEGCDKRSFKQIKADILGKGSLAELDDIEQQDEETYGHAALQNISLHGPAWLGLGRDIRLFSVDMRQSETDPWAWVEPRLAGKPAELPENEGKGVQYRFIMGRGIGCAKNFSRRLHKGSLPILTITVKDKDVEYITTAFASLEKSPLETESLRGTHYLVADHYGVDSYLTAEQEALKNSLLESTRDPDEETVLYMRTVIRNTGRVPRYAWYKAPKPSFQKQYEQPFQSGMAAYSKDRVYCVAKIGGEPLPQEEIALLVNPGDTVLIDAAIPHMPVSRKRAERLLEQEFAARLSECEGYWEQKHAGAAGISVPEKKVNEMIRAGLFHLDIATYGMEPQGPLSPTIGVYSALASESWPIVLYYDSMGLHDMARRCIRYFFDKQHEDGFMRNYGHYMLETGVVLWFTAEHYYHTRDERWLMSVLPGIRKAVDYLLAWRERNKREDLRGKGYGMLEGQSSDTPDGERRMYLLNALTYKGLYHISRVCLPLDQSYWGPVCEEVACLRADIRVSIADNMARGPVVPLGSGEWCPTMAPWAGGEGPVSLLNDGRNWHTHGMFVARDSHMHQLIFCDILDQDDLFAEFIMKYHVEQFFIGNVRPSQPYYSRHPYLHLIRGEDKAFICNYYNALTSLADRETYSFWEHYFHASPHKTHEEGCFLMETRWMLYLEQGDTLRLLMGAPGKWMEQGKRISIVDASSHFGHFSMVAKSRLAEGIITVDIDFADPARLPKTILLRIPHPQRKTPARVDGGSYCSRRKCVVIEPAASKIRVTAYFV